MTEQLQNVFRTMFVTLIALSLACSSDSGLGGNPLINGTPEAPQNLKAVAESEAAITLSWLASEMAESYVIEGAAGENPADSDFSVAKTVAAESTLTSIEGFQPSTAYTFRIKARNLYGDSAPSNHATATTHEEGEGTAPNPPTLFHSTFEGENEIHLAWADNSSFETEYVLLIKEADLAFRAPISLPATTISYKATQLSPNTQYTFRLSAKNDAGESFADDLIARTKVEDQGVTSPTDPFNLTADSEGQQTSIRLDWQHNGFDVTSFRLERRAETESQFGSIAIPPAGARSHLDTMLPPGTQYFYRVFAINGNTPSLPSNEASATTAPADSPPPDPTNLSAQPDSYFKQVVLDWQDNAAPGDADNETHFSIMRKDGPITSSSPYAEIVQVAADEITYTDDTVAYASEYTYQVFAVNAAGPSLNGSNEIDVSTASEPVTNLPAPTNLVATKIAGPHIRLTWTDNSDSEVNFHLERKVDDQSFASAFIVNASPGTGQTVVQVDDTVTGGHTYHYQVFARALTEDSPPSNVSNPITISGSEITPEAPTLQSATANGQHAIDLVWNHPQEFITGFEIHRRKDTETNFVVAGTSVAGAFTFADSGLEAGTIYIYKVQAVNESLRSPFSGEASAETDASTDAPPQPTGLIAQPDAQLPEVVVTWIDNALPGDPNNETRFAVMRKDGPITGGGTYAEIASVGADIATYTDLSVAHNTQYTYQVIAYRNTIPSDPSNEDSAWTALEPGDPLPAPTDVVATPLSGTQIEVSWTDNSMQEDIFFIERSVDGGGFITFGLIQPGVPGSGSTVTWTDTNVASGHTYQYLVWVRDDDEGWDDSVQSLPSNIVTIP